MTPVTQYPRKAARPAKPFVPKSSQEQSQPVASPPAKARLCIMLPRFSTYGGVEQFGARLAQALVQHGYAVDFICARQEAEAPAGVRVLCTGRPHGSQFVKMLWFCLRAEKLRRKGAYDCSISLGKTLKQDILRVGGGPLRTFWRLSAESYPQGWRRFWKGLCRRLSPANRLTLFLEKRQCDGNTKLIAVSHQVRDWLLQNYPGLRADDITLVYNKPNLARFKRPTPTERSGSRIFFNIPEDVVAIGTASSNFRLKGLAYLIKALVFLPENYHLFVAGGRGHKIYDELAKRLGVAGRVHFLGRVDRMAEFYQALDIFALPTFYDACSNAVLEALASGIGVLSSKNNGSAYFLQKGQLVDPIDDVEGMARKIAEQYKRDETGDFVWPETLLTGVEGTVAVVEDFLRAKYENL